MSYELNVVYDEQDNLEIWIPEFDQEDEYDTEPGPYETFSNAKLKGSPLALDWLLIDGFSQSFERVITEVKEKEIAFPDRYDVPAFGLSVVPLSRVLEYIYNTLLPDHLMEEEMITTITGQTIILPPEIVRRANLQDNTRLIVKLVDPNTLQLRRVS